VAIVEKGSIISWRQQRNGQGTKAAASLSQRAVSGEYPAMPDVELARGQVINLYFSSKDIAGSRTRSVFGDVSPKKFTLMRMYVNFSGWYFSTGVTCPCDSAGCFRGAASFHVVCGILLLALPFPVEELFSISVSTPGGKQSL
jgi:hypothetical protein